MRKLVGRELKEIMKVEWLVGMQRREVEHKLIIYATGARAYLRRYLSSMLSR